MYCTVLRTGPILLLTPQSSFFLLSVRYLFRNMLASLPTSPSAFVALTQLNTLWVTSCNPSRVFLFPISNLAQLSISADALPLFHFLFLQLFLAFIPEQTLTIGDSSSRSFIFILSSSPPDSDLTNNLLSELLVGSLFPLPALSSL